MAAFAGALIRRTVPAIAATLACWTVLDVYTMDSLRRHYLTPLTASGNNPLAAAENSTWLQDVWYAAPGGTPANAYALYQQAQAGGRVPAGPNGFMTWLTQHHYTQWWSYQPGDRFWPFQLIESGWLLGLSLVLLAATIWIVRRRAA